MADDTARDRADAAAETVQGRATPAPDVARTAPGAVGADAYHRAHCQGWPSMCGCGGPEPAPVPDGLADRLVVNCDNRDHEEHEDGPEVATWRVEWPDGEHDAANVCDDCLTTALDLAASDRKALRITPLAALAASPPAAPTGEPEPGGGLRWLLTWSLGVGAERYTTEEPALRQVEALRARAESEGLFLRVELDCDGDPHFRLCSDPGPPAPSGETADRARERLREAFRWAVYIGGPLVAYGRDTSEQYNVSPDALADLALASVAPLLATPAQAGGPCPYVVVGEEGTAYCRLAEHGPTNRAAFALHGERESLAEVTAQYEAANAEVARLRAERDALAEAGDALAELLAIWAPPDPDHPARVAVAAWRAHRTPAAVLASVHEAAGGEG